jgi:hypothetical protein
MPSGFLPLGAWSGVNEGRRETLGRRKFAISDKVHMMSKVIFE